MQQVKLSDLFSASCVNTLLTICQVSGWRLCNYFCDGLTFIKKQKQDVMLKYFNTIQIQNTPTQVIFLSTCPELCGQTDISLIHQFCCSFLHTFTFVINKMNPHYPPKEKMTNLDNKRRHLCASQTFDTWAPPCGWRGHYTSKTKTDFHLKYLLFFQNIWNHSVYLIK